MDQFDVWNSKKKFIVLTHKPRYYRPREIWWCILGKNIGSEQNGVGRNFIRPIIIIKALGEICLVVPLSTSIYKHPYRIFIGNISGKKSCVIISQLRTIDSRRLVEKVGILDKKFFEITRKAIKDML